MNREFLKKIWGGSAKSCLGIDIGTTSIKAVELERENNRARLVNYGTLALADYGRPAGALHASSLRLFETDVVNYLQLLLQKTNMRARNAVASLPSFAIFSTIINLPPMPEKEVIQAVQFKARQYIPLPISSVSLDWVRIHEQKVLLLAIPNELIQKYTAIFKSAGLNLITLEAEGISCARALSTQGSDTDAEPVLVIDIGTRSTGFFIIAAGLLQLMGQSDFAGASLTHSIASGLGITPRRAEDIKREQGIIRGGANELSTLLVPLIDGILNEASRLRERFTAANEKKDIRGVALAGGGAHLPGLVDYAAQKFNVPVVKARPWIHCAYPVAAEAALAPRGSELTIAVGAAMKGIQI